MADIEYFNFTNSLFAYLGAARLTEIVKAAGRRIAHRPMNLNKVLKGIGATPFSERSKAHMTYYFGREEERCVAVKGQRVLERQRS